MSKTFCSLPWIHLCTHPIGEVTLCCQVDVVNGQGTARNIGRDRSLNLNDHTIEEVFNSDSFKEVRRQMLRGERPDACKKCFWQEDSGLVSRRINDTEKYGYGIKDARKNTSEDGSISPQIITTELRLGNKCNLKCSTCNPSSSSLWTEEYKEVTDNEAIPLSVDYNGINESMFQWPHEKSFWKQFEGHFNTIKNININGGEPTLIKEHYDFLENLVVKGNSKDITLEYHLNMTSIPKRLETIWNEFEKVVVSASIDDVGDRNNFIRYPSRWDKVEANFKKLSEMNVDLILLQTVSVYNFLTIEELYLHFRKEYKEYKHSLNYVSDPYFLSPMTLPPEVRRKKIKELFGKMPLDNYRELVKLYFNDEFNEKDLDIFKSYNSILIKNRKNNFSSDFQHLASI